MNRGEKRPGEPDGAYGSSQPRARGLGRGNEQESSAEARRKLEAMFSGSGSSGASAFGRGPQVGERVFASPRKGMGRTPSEYRMRLERVRLAREVEEIRQAADAFLCHHQLPDDPDILYKLLQHPSEEVLKDVMGQISSLLMQRRLGKLMILDARLAEVSARIQGEVTKQFVAGLREQMLRFSSETAAPAVVTSLGRAS